MPSLLDVLLTQPLILGVIGGALYYVDFELRERVWQLCMKGPTRNWIIGRSLWMKRSKPRRRRHVNATFWALLVGLLTYGAATLGLLSRTLGEAAVGLMLVPYLWRLSNRLFENSLLAWNQRHPKGVEGTVQYSDAFMRAHYPRRTLATAGGLGLLLPFTFTPFLAGGVLGLLATAGKEWLQLAPRGKR